MLGRRAAVILPRYGASLGGGAETLTRELFLKLIEHGVIASGEVWTTCAIDHRTWKNELPPGKTIEDGIPITRFSVDERDLEPFIQAEIKLSHGEELTLDEQIAWMENGVNSKALYQHISDNQSKFDLLLFAPYLFPTSFWGPLIAPEKSIVIPCLHDEPYAYNRIFGALFSSVKGFFFNARAEQQLAESIYYNADLKSRSGVVGLGFEMDQVRATGLISKFGLTAKGYLLFSGRKERGKNLPLLLDYYERLPLKIKEELPLVLIGSGEIDFRPELPGFVIDLGFVSEEEKLELMAGALALCQPSTNESFSIVLLEAFLQETPALVHSECPVTSDHVISANGGLCFKDASEFISCVELLVNDRQTAFELGKQARRYVESNFNWHSVVERAKSTLERVGL